MYNEENEKINAEENADLTENDINEKMCLPLMRIYMMTAMIFTAV